MPDDSTFNIFNASSYQKKKSPLGVKKKAEKAVASGPAKTGLPEAIRVQPTKLDPEIEAMLTRMHDMHMDIEGKLKRIYELTGMDREKILSYADDPKNFSEEEWNTLQANREAIQSKILAFLGPRMRDRQRVVAQELQRKKASELTKNRKSKMIAARKKNWISMQ